MRDFSSRVVQEVVRGEGWDGLRTKMLSSMVKMEHFLGWELWKLWFGNVLQECNEAHTGTD